MNLSIPATWAETTVGVCFSEIKNGTTAEQNTEGRGIPVSRIETIQNSRFDLNRIRHIGSISHEALENFRYKSGDIAFSHINSLEHVGKTALYEGSPEIFVHGMNLLRLRLGHDQIEPKFAYFFMQTDFFREEIRKRVGHAVNQVSINQRNLSEVPFVIAPLPEQRRIVAKLEALLAKVDASRKRLERIPVILKRFRQAVLAAACDGRLTEDWRQKSPEKVDASSLLNLIQNSHLHAGGHRAGNAAAPTEDVHDLCVEMFPDGWRLTTLMELVRPDRPITYGILKPGPEVAGGIPYIRVADFPNDRLSMDGIRHTDPSIDFAFRRSRLQAGDILISIRGTVGRLIVIPPDLEGANITQDSARLSIQPAVDRDYVLWFLRSDMSQSRMRGAVKGVAVRGINIGDVRALQVPLPPLSEQKEIVRRIEQLLGIADQVEVRYAMAKTQVDRLTQSILTKAFRGELVPQDPNDEPADVLLSRLGAAPNEAPTPARRRGRPPRVQPAAPPVAPAAPAENREAPALADLTPEAIRQAHREVLASIPSPLSEDNLLRAVALRLGYQRLGGRIRVRIMEALTTINSNVSN